MTYDISSLFINTTSIPENFTKLGIFTSNIYSINALDTIPIYFIISECQRHVSVVQFLNNIINTENKIYLCTLYRWFKYTKGLLELLNFPQLWLNIKLLVTFKNNKHLNKCQIDTTVYIKNNFLNNYDYNKELPLLVYQLIYDINNELVIIPIIKSTNNNIIESAVKNENANGNENKNKNNLYKRPLYHYQLENIKWLSNIETRVSTKTLNFTSFLLENKHLFATYINHLKSNIIISDSMYCKINYNNFKNFSLKPRGGVLADNVGLGKTASFIGLITSTLNNDNDNDNDNDNNKTSLVICPRRLCYQWLEEINKTSNLKTEIISTVTQFKKYSINDINTLDVVIIPYSFLNNTNYLNYCKNIKKTCSQFMINTYYWKRVILDEGHEYINYSIVRKRKTPCYIRETLETLKSDFRWICSGTPYSDIHDFWKIINYLCPEDKDLLEANWSINHIKTNLVNNIFRRNTSESIRNEIIIPTQITETTFLKQTEIEKVIYNSVLGDHEKMIQLCSHILISEQHINILGNTPLSLSEIHTKMTEYYKKKIDRLNKQLINITNNENKETLQQQLDNNKSKFNIFNSISDKLEETKTCPICLELLNNTTKVVTNCGHFMCIICATNIFKGNWKNTIRCPMCRENINGNKLEIISTKNFDIPHIEKWGTKMANLIMYLNRILTSDNLDNRVIIFSQWNNMLKLVAKVLKEHDIKHLFINGSIYVVSSRISKFKKDTSIRVVLLSSDRAASGLNLTEASHIILLDTLNTSPEKARQIEDQAIGRSVRLGQKKKIIIKRFIMEDTIEHEYYLRNNSVQPYIQPISVN